MMENDGGTGDDQGSVWVEVKMKHRTSSKLLIQKVSMGSSDRIQSSPRRYEASNNIEAGTLHSKREIHPTQSEVAFVSHSEVSPDASGSSLAIEDHDIKSHGNVAVNQESKPLNVKNPGALMKVVRENEVEAIVEVPTKVNSDDISKIRSGDIEGSALMLSKGCAVTVVKAESGDRLDGHMQEHTNAVESDKLVAQMSSYTLLEEENITTEDVELVPDKVLSSDVHGEPLEGIWKEVSSENLGLMDANTNDATGNLKKPHGKGVARAAKNEPRHDLDSNDAIITSCPSKGISSEQPPIEGTIGLTLQDPCNESEDAALNVFEISVTEKGLPDSILLPHQNNGAEISIDPSDMEAMEVQMALQGHSTDGTDLGVAEDSKERFRERLWCFLFENLNRAVDELYLLCELECDMEQMNEAMLVLEEAGSDFQELKCRVEHFENTKRPSSQLSNDEMLINAKTDHRRPHALSWEVRRMTTSPHRAEILSSSLEAFKKIQMERARKHLTQDSKEPSNSFSTTQRNSRTSPRATNLPPRTREPGPNLDNQRMIFNAGHGNSKHEKLNVDSSRQSRAGFVQNGRLPPQGISASAAGKSKREPLEPISGTEKHISRKDKASAENKAEKQLKAMDPVKKQNSLVDKEREKEKRNTVPWKPLDAWKEKRNWEDILKSPMRGSTRISHSAGLARKGMERARVLHDKLMSPEKKKKTTLDLKREAEEKHTRAMRIRSQLENERVQRLQRTSEKLNRVNEWQAVRSLKLREGMHARHQKSESRHEAYLAQVVRRAGDESSKVNEVRFITSLNEENKKLILRQKLHDSEIRRAEKLQVIKTKQKEDTAREEAVLERRKLLEAEKLQRLAEIQRKKEEAQVRREEERKASSAAREAKALEQLRKKEVRARAQQEEAELLAQKLAERLSESEQRRKFYLEQIRERASMDFRDQSSPFMRRSLNKEGQSRSLSANSVEDYQASCISSAGDRARGPASVSQQQSLKRRIKKIRQKLMALKHEFTEPPIGAENSGFGYRSLMGSARAKLGRWLQDLQKLRQARKEGAASIGLIVGEMVKFLEGKDLELHASRQAGLLDFISSALPASHTSKPEACQVTIYLLRLLRVMLSVPANRSYFLAHNLLPPIIPMLSASVENYIKIAASSSPGSSALLTSKTSSENLESIAEVLDGSLWTVTIILGHAHTDERQLKMQDGLMELIVAYQIIHHLRDLFALYDRPQVEGSPFPSSILLSLNLLAVLTSASRTISSIDWEACISRAAPENKVQETKELEIKDLEDSLTHMIADVPANESNEIFEKLESSRLSLSDIQDDMPLDGEFRKDSLNVSDGLGNVEALKCTGPTSGIQNMMIEEHAKSPSPPKDEKNSFDGCSERKGIADCTVHDSIDSRKGCRLKQPVLFLLSAIAETGLVGLPSLLTAVLLQANNRLSSEQASYILPSNFEEVATGVLKVLNNLALLDITLLQRLLARADLKMEFFHLMSFLLSYCTNKWKAANDQVGLLLLESLLLLGYFALFYPGNQAVLRWGKSPTILHKVCDLPFVFFSDPELTPILASTLVAACYGCEQNRGVVLQELSADMLLSLLKSCRQALLAAHSDTSPPDCSMAVDPCDGTQLVPEVRKLQDDTPQRPNRRTSRAVLSKGGVSSGNGRANKGKIQRDIRGTKTCDEWAVRHNLPASESSHSFMLHLRLPTAFLDKAEEFFASGSSDLPV